MTQRHVEIAIGRLVTDEDARRSLRESPAALIDRLKDLGLDFSAAEEAALLAIDPRACERFARTLDPRIHKVSLAPPARVRHGRPRGSR
jgi:hypothetical protein